MIPVCCYPTTVVMIDDNEDYLNNISLHLPRKNSCFKFYSNPISGLKSIQEGLKIPSVSNRINHYSRNHSYDKIINESNLVSEIYNDDRFKEISLIIIDYGMPGMSGLEFLRQLSNKNVLKILLTGEADETIALQAFHDNLINHYLKKHDPNIEKILSQKILEFQKKYFLNFSEKLIETRFTEEPYQIATTDETFAEYFFNIISNLNIIEYYQFEKVGSYLLIDANGTEYCLFTQNEDQINASYIELKGLVDDQEIEAIKNRSKMICLPIAPKNIINNPENWLQYLHPIQKTFQNNQGSFYCTIVHQGCGLNIQNILSFNVFLEAQNSVLFSGV